MQDPVPVMMVSMCQSAALGPKSKGSWTPALFVPQVQVSNSSRQTNIHSNASSSSLGCKVPRLSLKHSFNSSLARLTGRMSAGGFGGKAAESTGAIWEFKPDDRAEEPRTTQGKQGKSVSFASLSQSESPGLLTTVISGFSSPWCVPVTLTPGSRYGLSYNPLLPF